MPCSFLAIGRSKKILALSKHKKQSTKKIYKAIEGQEASDLTKDKAVALN